MKVSRGPHCRTGHPMCQLRVPPCSVCRLQRHFTNKRADYAGRWLFAKCYWERLCPGLLPRWKPPVSGQSCTPLSGVDAEAQGGRAEGTQPRSGQAGVSSGP